MNTKMNQPITRMGNGRRVSRDVNEKMEVFVHMRGTPAQIRGAHHLQTAVNQQGNTAYSISGSGTTAYSISGSGTTAYSIASGSAYSGVQVAEIESGAKDEEICKAKLCCGGCCCITFSPLVKIAAFLSTAITFCC